MLLLNEQDIEFINLNKFLIRIVFVVLLVVFTGESLLGQQIKRTPESQIAMQYYRNGEYKKAAEIYKRLYYTNRSHSYYQFYFKCLVNIKHYIEAEELVKEQIKFNKRNLAYRVDLGYLLQVQGQQAKAKNTYATAIKKLTPNQHQVIRLANAFLSKREYNFAEETYNQGKKLLKDTYGFESEMAQLFYYQRDYVRMVDQYLLLLKKSDQYLKMIQSRLQNAVHNDIDNSLKDILRAALLKELNENAEQTSVSELLIWLYIQESDFEGAFIQARALDLRLNENGTRLIALARIATDNSNFSVAVDAYKYVINKGKHLEYFYAARDEMLNVMFKRIKLGLDTQKEDFIRLEESYTTALSEMGVNRETIDLVKNLAHLKAFYLNKTAEAWFLLEDAVNMQGIDKMTKGQLELELADIYLADGKVWEATFAYARIEEYNKNNYVGAEAKFRKGRLAYYIGNFEWAQAQLDVLKASTSKLIANDAAHLALFIYDNTGWDSVETAMEIYSRADLLYYQSKDSLALVTLDTVLSIYSSHVLADEAWFLKAKILAKNHKYEQAIEAYGKVIELYYHDILADKSLFALADIHENHLKNIPEAQNYYQKLLVDFPGSIFTVEARKRFRILRGDKIVN